MASKIYALLFALLIAGLIASDVFILNSLIIKEFDREEVIVSRVIDGDTLEIQDGRKIRLANINSPEKGMPGYEQSTNFLKTYENKTLEIETISTDRYGRTLARLYSTDYINLLLVESGLSSKFLVQKSELSLFAEAEEFAIENSKGIWEHSSYLGCFEFEIDEVNEKIEISNSCNNINMKGWMIKDESRKNYIFQNQIFSEITLHSGKGESNATDLFWGSSTNVWNNDRDSLYLFDSNGGIAGYATYGY